MSEIKVLEHGYVKLIDTMGDDSAIVQAARLSYDNRGSSADERLIRRLMRDQHTSPFEMVEFKFEIKLPIFVMRQWVRHRTASLNEVSARYTQLPDEMHVPEPEDLKTQSKTNKQGREGDYESHTAYGIRKAIKHANRNSYDVYEELLEEYDLTRELARGVLPVNTYTKCVWKINLHNLLHFLKLRTDKHAQAEIRVYADAVEEMVKTVVPMTHKAWVNYQKEAVSLSQDEVTLIRELLNFYMYKRPYMGSELERERRANAINAWAKSVLTENEMKEFNKRFLSDG